MERIIQLQSQVEKAVKALSYPQQPGDLYDPIRYIMDLGGKRMRPVLVLMGYRLFNTNTEKALPAAMAVELFHNFTLMHDDIMDNAPIRRGKQSVHEKWGTNSAILSGDAMMVEAYHQLQQLDKEILYKIFPIFNKIAMEVCQGQQLDMDFESRNDVSIDEYLQMIELKTAVLLAGSLKIGALIAGANNEDAKLLYEFGRNMGIAFQLQDDLLDVYGDPDKFGKQVGGDIISNKKTYLLLKALELAQGTEQEELQSWIDRKEYDPAQKVMAVKNGYSKLGIAELTTTAMELYANKAIEALNKVNAPLEDKEALRFFAEKLMAREK